MQLHKRDVVDAATTILDSYGIADLTMRRLARELDVSPGALYWHFDNKQQLLGAIADRLLETVLTVDDPSTPWRDRITAIGTRLRDALLTHTDGAELVSGSFAAGQSTGAAEVLTRLTAAAAQAGIAETHAGLAARTVVYYTLGFTVDEQSRMQLDSAGALPTDQPALTEDPSARFRFGLRLLLDGIAANAPAIT